ncbi:amino acid adenylation domain-containing protein [Williamsia sp. SKLECPSW1]
MLIGDPPATTGRETGHAMTASAVRRIVAEALDVDPDTLDPDTDLIGQGLDSLRMMRLAGRWRREGFDIDFARLAEAPTIAAWSELLGAPADAPTAPDTPPDAAPVADDETDAFPLAPMQHAYWVGRSDSHDLGGVAAHLYVEFDGGAVDPDRFRAAVAALVERHPMTRVTVRPDGTQEVGPAHPDITTVTDLRRASAPAVEDFLTRTRAAKTHAMLPVEEGQVLSIDLTLLPRGRSRVHLDVDMIAADAMSFRVLVDDLARLHRGESLPPIGIDFRTLTARRQGRATRAADVEWWRSRIPELPGPPELPRSMQDPHGSGATTVRLHHAIDAADRERLERAAHRHGVTPAAAVAAAFAEAVGSHATRPRFLLTVPLFDRDDTDPDVDRVVGDFTSSIVVAVDLSTPATISDRAQALRESMHEAAVHGSVSGLDVLRDLSRLRGEPVLSPVVFTSALGLGELFSPAVTDAFGDPGWIVSQGPQVLLDAQVTEVDGGLLLNWDVRVSDLDESVARSMFDHYVRVLGMLVDDDWDRPAPSAVPTEVLAERRSCEHRLPDVEVFDGTLHGEFLRRAPSRADAPAIADSTRTWTHAEVADRALRVAGALRAHGVAPGDTVVLHLPKSAEQVVAAIGILAAGAAYVPIAPSQPTTRRERIVDVATPAAVLTDIPSDWQGVDAAVVDIACTVSADPVDAVSADPDALAYVLFTSGSTGLPKGVEVPHSAAVATLTDLVTRFSLDDSDRSLMVSSLEFDLSVFDVFALLAVGGSVTVADDDPTTRVDSWVGHLAGDGVTVLNCVPTVLGMLTDLTSMPSSLRVVLTGGDRVEVAHLRRIADQVPGVRVAGLGGTTETAIHSTVCELADVPDGAVFVPYGVPLDGVRCRVVDPVGHDRPDFVAGELWIGGAGVARGYRADPARTADRFVEVDGTRWYRTGDIARYLPGAFLDFLGRDDHMVKVRGHRVELGEVEAGLLDVDGVRSAVAWSDGRDLRAAVVLVDGTAPTDGDALLDGLRTVLPATMLPRSVTVVDALPLTSNGKIDRSRVAAELDTHDIPATVAPRGPVESALVALAETVLDTRPIGVTDEFVALGGDSVLATRFVAEIRRWLAMPGGQASATVADVFTHRTVAALAEVLVARHGDAITEVASVMLEVLGLSADEVETQLAEQGPDDAADLTGLAARITHRRFDLDADLPTVHGWLTHEKAAFWDMLTADESAVAEMIRHGDATGPGYRVGLLDGRPQFLFELYDPRISELAEPGTGYTPAEGDLGMHILVAPTDRPVPGFTEAAMRHVMRTAFDVHDATRVVVEPDVRNTAIHRLNALVGFRVLGDHRVGAKTARVSICRRADLTAATEDTP